MKLIAAFLKLIRLPNLFFIALSQVLFQFCIYRPLYKDAIPAADNRHFIFLVLASFFIAAAGYIINDYFDINIDEVNKPQKMVVDKWINRRWAIALHFLFNTLGLLCSFLAFPFLQKWYLILANILCMVLLWFYSTNFKRQLLTGNVVISLLTAWTILIVFFSKVDFAAAFGAGPVTHGKLFKIAVLYAAFAFIITLIREALKDMEDLQGDAQYKCKTMPILWGIQATKVYVAVWLVVLIALLIAVIAYVLQYQWWLAVAYIIPAIIFPLIIILIKLKKSMTSADFHILSSLTKLVMFTGILSMVFYYFYL